MLLHFLLTQINSVQEHCISFQSTNVKRFLPHLAFDKERVKN